MRNYYRWCNTQTLCSNTQNGVVKNVTGTWLSCRHILYPATVFVVHEFVTREGPVTTQWCVYFTAAGVITHTQTETHRDTLILRYTEKPHKHTHQRTSADWLSKWLYNLFIAQGKSLGSLYTSQKWFWFDFLNTFYTHTQTHTHHGRMCFIANALHSDLLVLLWSVKAPLLPSLAPLFSKFGLLWFKTNMELITLLKHLA